MKNRTSGYSQRLRRFTPLLSLLLTPLSLVTSINAYATDTGISGASGKQGLICSACHLGGSFESSLAISGSTEVEPGSTNNFSVLMTTDGPFAGFNLATADGTLTFSDSGMRKLGDELTHITKRATVNGLAQWDFQWVAPSTPGDNTFWVCSLTVDGNGTNTNDDATPSCITQTITVSSAQTPTATNDSASVNEDSSVAINVTSNDSDNDGSIDTSSVTIVSGVSNGSTSISSSGVVTYTPSGNFNGSDSFSYNVKDNDGLASIPPRFQLPSMR